MMRMVFRGIITPAIALCLMGAASTSEVQFIDITEQAKIDFKQENSATSDKYLIETMGGGVALLDYDNDGRLDIFLTNGALIDDPMPDGKMPDKSERKFWNRLYHQNADGTFTDVTERSGLSGMLQGYYSMGVAVGDYDNDRFWRQHSLSQ
jgi:enediyne biosynthesis protein E4